MTKQISITLNDWVVDEILRDVKNKSAKIEEALIKAYMCEKEKAFKEAQTLSGKMGTKLKLVYAYLFLRLHKSRV